MNEYNEYNEYYEDDEHSDDMEPESWLSMVMHFMTDKHMKQKLVERVASRTGLEVEKVEAVLHTLAEALINVTRSN